MFADDLKQMSTETLLGMFRELQSGSHDREAVRSEIWRREEYKIMFARLIGKKLSTMSDFDLKWVSKNAKLSINRQRAEYRLQRRRMCSISLEEMTDEELEQASATNSISDIYKYTQVQRERAHRRIVALAAKWGDETAPENSKFRPDKEYDHVARVQKIRCRKQLLDALNGGDYSDSVTGRWVEGMFIVDSFRRSIPTKPKDPACYTAAEHIQGQEITRRAALEQARLAYECHQFYDPDFIDPMTGLLYRGLCYTCHSHKTDPIHLRDGEQADARIKALKAGL